MSVLLSLCEIVGWVTFLFLGGAGVYELLGNRRVRATALLAASFTWIIALFFALKMGRMGGVAGIFPVVFIAASIWLVRRVKASLGKPDMDWR